MEINSTGGFFSELTDNWPSAYEVYLKIETSETIYWVRQKSTYLLPILCIVGIVGNSMALMLIRTNFWLKRLTSAIYLCALSVSSCLFLSTLLVTWADSLYQISLYNNENGCKIFTFLAHWSDFICVWMIIWISCDRMIVLYRPGIRKWVCTKKFACYLLLGTSLLSGFLYCWVFLFAGQERQLAANGNVYIFCGLSANATFLGFHVSDYYIYFTLMDTVVCTVLPSVIIIIVNSFSTYRYRKCMKIYSAGILRVRFSNNNHHINEIENEPEKVTVRYMEPQDEISAKRLLLSPSQTKQHPTSTVTQTGGSGSQLSSQSRCGKLRSSDLQLSRTLLIVTSPQMKKQLKPTAVRLLECYCLKSVPEFGHRSTSGGR